MKHPSPQTTCTNTADTEPFGENGSEIEHAILTGITRYFDESRQHIPAFVNKHFCYPGCWQTNRYAFGLDLLRAPINLIWAPFYIVIMLCFQTASVLGLKRSNTLAARIPGGFTTNVQTYVNQTILSELVDVRQLSAYVMEDIATLIPHIPASRRADVLEHTERIIHEAMQQLMMTRIASADITNTVLSTAIGAFAFKKFTPGGIGIGVLIAAYWAKEQAESSFFLGSTIGGWYYAIFPPTPDYLELSAGIGIAMLLLAIFASFSGLITDPIQSKLGLHQRRLRRMLVQLERDIGQRSQSRFKPLDPYVARIFELLDTLKPLV